MINDVVRLSHALRDKGLTVSIRSSRTASDVCDLIGIGDRELLKESLKAVYVKDKYDIPKFNEVFEEIFKEETVDDVEKDILKKSNQNTLSKNRYNNSNKMRIKKKGGAKNKVNPNLKNNKQLLDLTGTPPLEDIDRLQRDGELLNKDLTKLNNFDPRMLTLCQQLGKRIANKRSRRKNLQKSNKVDMRRTIRNNLKYGGIPLDLVKTKPRPHKNEHLFLNDISGSCEWISSWFFMLVYSAQTSFKHSKTFEFDNKVIETTSALNSNYLINAFAEVRTMRMKNAMVHGSSNMYSAFKSFLKKANLNNKSYILLLSDCRDWGGPKDEDGLPKSAHLISEMVRQSKKVVILNPEDRYKWDVVDSCVSLYEEAGAKVYEVNTLNQLADFIMSI